MHDWSLISISIDWLTSTIKVKLRNHKSKKIILMADKFVDFKISKKDEWGESISINKVLIFKKLENGNFYIKIEIQSGDLCEIEAKEITFPKDFKI